MATRKRVAEITQSMREKKAKPPRIASNLEGYLSPNYQRMANNLASLSTEQRKQFEDILAARRAPLEQRTIETPVEIQSTGQPQRGRRNRNPGNLKTTPEGNPLPGAVGVSDGFSVFPSAEIGMRALERQVRIDRERDMTVEEFFYKYAPPSSNNTELYIQQATRRLGVPRDASTRNIRPGDLAQMIAYKESHTRVR